MIGKIIFFCFLLSGLSSLIYEVLWVRMLILIFGSTTFAISTVLTSFMGGLALGSYLFGRTIDRSRRPLPLYGALETGIGVYALFVPTLFSALIPLYRWAWQSFHVNFYLFSLMQFLLVSLVLLIPTTLMGATLPILGRYYSRRDDRLGLTVGSLYAVNTLGGILGTFLSAFFLIPALGVRNTTFAAAILNLLIGGIVIFAVRTKEAGGQDQRHLPSDVSPLPLPGERLAPRSLPGHVCLCPFRVCLHDLRGGLEPGSGADPGFFHLRLYDHAHHFPGGDCPGELSHVPGRRPHGPPALGLRPHRGGDRGFGFPGPIPLCGTSLPLCRSLPLFPAVPEFHFFLQISPGRGGDVSPHTFYRGPLSPRGQAVHDEPEPRGTIHRGRLFSEHPRLHPGVLLRRVFLRALPRDPEKHTPGGLP